MRGHPARPRLAGLPLLARSLLAFAAPASAFADVPPPEYFTGVYQRIGRSSGANPVLLNDLWRIDPAQTGALHLSPCTRSGNTNTNTNTNGTATSIGSAHDLRFARFGDLTNLLEGDGGLWCQVFNDGGNYPLLSCGAEDGSAFQMRAVTDDRASACVAD